MLLASELARKGAAITVIMRTRTNHCRSGRDALVALPNITVVADVTASHRKSTRDRLEPGGGMNRVVMLAGGRDEMAGSA